MNTSKIMRRLGWLCFTLMWIPFITLFIGMIGMPDGSYDWIEIPLLSRVSIVAVGALSVLSTLLLVGAPIVSGFENRRILQSGRTALARVLEIHDTGTTINQNPVVRLVLQVEPDGAPPFHAEAERLISRLQIPQVQPGEVVMVKYDPETGEVALMDEGGF